jgi:hypothetical protein
MKRDKADFVALAVDAEVHHAFAAVNIAHQEPA